MDLEQVKIRRIIGPTPSGAAVLLGNEKKTFVVFVGLFEAAALIREINGEQPARPLTHELLQNVFLGFDIRVKRVVISSIIENTFCATLVLEQAIEAGEEWVGKRNEVRIDARPSDCLVLALKNNVDIYVTESVFKKVQDISNMTAEGEGLGQDVSLEELEHEISGKLGDFESFPPGLNPFEDDDDEDDDGYDDDEDETDPEYGGGGLSFRSGQ